MTSRPSERPSDAAAIRRSLLGLTVVTGVVDAVSFLGLGHIFTANMTGNVVFLGFAIGGGEGVSAIRSLTALVAFACGGICAGRAINARNRPPARSLLMAMCLESLLLLIAVACTARVTSELSLVAAYAVIVLTAVAMGFRNAVVRKLGVPDLTTTVLTLTITALAAESQLADREANGRRALSIVAMCAGAVGGVVLLRRFGLAMALAAAAIVVVALTCFLYLSTSDGNTN